MEPKTKLRINRRAQAVMTCAFAILFRLTSGAPIYARAAAMQKADDTAAQHFKLAQEAYNARQYDKTRSELKRALKLNNRMVDAYLLRGMTYRDEGNYKAAINSVEQAIKLQSNYPDGHYLLAVLNLETRKLSKARTEIDLAMAQGVSFANAYSLKGKIELLEHHSPQARDLFEEALRRAPPNDASLPTLQRQVMALRSLKERADNKDDSTYTYPKLLNSPGPSYTDEARAANIQGSVHVAIQVNEAGNVTDSVVFIGLGFGLDEQALRAARRLKFKPAIKDGKPFAVWLRVDIEFHLR